MDKWKAIALVSASFAAGMVYTTACSDKPGRSPMDAHAGDDDTGSEAGTPPPAGGGAGRAVVELYTDPTTVCLPTVELENNSMYWYSVPAVTDSGDSSPLDPWNGTQGTNLGPPTVSAPACSCPSGFSFVGWSGSDTIACLED